MKAINKHNFDTEKQRFGADYADKAHLQGSFNKNTIERFAEKISKSFEEGRYGKGPLNIADI